MNKQPTPNADKKYPHAKCLWRCSTSGETYVAAPANMGNKSLRLDHCYGVVDDDNKLLEKFMMPPGLLGWLSVTS